MAKDKGGQPTKMTPATLKKLAFAFLCDATDDQACKYAGISTTTLYNYQLANPKYLEEKRLLKEDMKFKAKVRLSKDVSKKTHVAMWLLERLEKDKYSVRNEFTGAGGGPINYDAIDPEMRKKIESALDKVERNYKTNK